MAEVQVRRVGPEDWAALRAVRLAALADAPAAFLTTLDEASAYPEARWRQRLAESAHFLAYAADRPVGMAVGLLHGDVPELVSLWVAPGARGTGAVDALLDAVAGWAVDAGHVRLHLWVVDGNDRAERVYLRHGYRRTGVSQPVRGREHESEAQLARDLPPAGRREVTGGG